jgi:osmoprotectant transport system permease protein
MTGPFADALRLLPDYLGSHVLLSALALALGTLVAIPLAVAAARRPRLRIGALTVASLLQTIPSLALLALFYPLLLGLSALISPVTGLSIPALGFLPSVLALTLYSILPVLRNTIVGLEGLDPTTLAAADAVGMTPRQRFLRVEVPLAAPSAMAGIRTAAVWTIGAATLSTSVGQTSLGNYIFTGLQTENWTFVLFGCAAAAAAAFVTDQLLGVVETGVTRRDRKRILFGLGSLAAGTIAALVPLTVGGSATYRVGAKNFSEQFILADLIVQQIEAAGAAASRIENLGSAVVFRALAGNDIDVYVDYTGTLWTNVLGRTDLLPKETLRAELSQALSEKYGVRLLGALGFENAYVLAMRPDRATTLGVRTIADLARFAPRLTLGADLEFLSRPEWRALSAAYGLDFARTRSFSPTLMYRAIEDGSVDVISAFSSDGRIAADGLMVLDDPKHVTPNYDAVLLIAPKRSADARLLDALQPLIGKITLDAMRKANLMVDRDTGKASPREAAHGLGGSVGLRE